MRRPVPVASGSADRQRKTGAEQDLRDDGRERQAEERGVDMGGERLLPEPGVQEYSEHDRPDVEQVLAEQREPEHEKQARHRGTRHPRSGLVINQTCAQGQQPGIDAGGPDPADAEIIGEQRVTRRQYLLEPADDFGWRVDQQSEGHEGRRVRGHDQQDDSFPAPALPGRHSGWNQSWSSACDLSSACPVVTHELTGQLHAPSLAELCQSKALLLHPGLDLSAISRA